jgi:hypothetical protein
MVKHEQEFNVKLVEAVELYPCLYNYQLPEYARKDITENAWAKVAQQVNKPGKYLIFFVIPLSFSSVLQFVSKTKMFTSGKFARTFFFTYVDGRYSGNMAFLFVFYRLGCCFSVKK